MARLRNAIDRGENCSRFEECSDLMDIRRTCLLLDLISARQHIKSWEGLMDLVEVCSLPFQLTGVLGPLAQLVSLSCKVVAG